MDRGGPFIYWLGYPAIVSVSTDYANIYQGIVPLLFRDTVAELPSMFIPKGNEYTSLTGFVSRLG